MLAGGKANPIEWTRRILIYLSYFEVVDKKKNAFNAQKN